ncbi:MAG: S8 family peptidase [Promethearchaeota archaeon]
MSYLNSNLAQNYTNSIPNTERPVVRISEEVETELHAKIISWGELIANNSNLSNIDNIISYPDDALVNLRNDNKIEFIVKRDTLEFSQEVNEFLSKYNVQIHEDVPYFNASIIYTPVENLGEFISESESIFGISYIEPNFYVELDFIPNDEYYKSDLWALPHIGMESAWDYELGSNEVVVSVVDTGIDYTHPDLSGNYLSWGYDWVNDDSDPMDDHYHGTHCAGTIAALINNKIGVAGMANVSIFAEKAFSYLGSGSHIDCRLALMHAADMGADIISCSWGGSHSQTLEEGINYAINQGVMVIAAAGNTNSNASHYPAAYPGVVAVSATDRDDHKAGFSNYGDWIDVSAPGVDIFSTVPYEIKGSYYYSASGTSMATPHVSGFAALLISAFPTYNAEQIASLIYDSALDLGDPGFDSYYGYGRIDATNAFGPDITPPVYSNLVESADPLLLGNTEIIRIEITDHSGINQVLIEFEGLNHSMTNIYEETWQYDSWTPSNTGNYPYTIYMEDNNNNWNSVSDSIEVKEDTEPPAYSKLIESADPLELGKVEVISIEITDLSGVSQVLIEFEGSNHTMMKIGEEKWHYDSWIPKSVGNYPYTIYMEDFYNHMSSISNYIQVIDSTPPIGKLLTNNTGPLELGDSKSILIKVTDLSGVNKVLIEIDKILHPMAYLGGDVWKFEDFTPLNIGIYDYIIYMGDNFENWGMVKSSIEVNDTKSPTIPKLIDFPLGEISGKIIFNWEDGNDPSGIDFYRLIIDNESDPFFTLGVLFEVNISNTGSESSYLELEESFLPGTYYFFLYQIDGVGHQSLPATGEFFITLPKGEIPKVIDTSNMMPFFLIIIATSLIGISGYAIVRKVKMGKNIKPLNKKFEVKDYNIIIKNLRTDRLNLEKDANTSVKAGNYKKASMLYKQCEDISNDLFKHGIISEAEKAKYYANKRFKTFQIQERKISFIKTNINAFLTLYFDISGIKYYSNPEIYPGNQNEINGLILNDVLFLRGILVNLKKDKLNQKLSMNLQTLTNFKAFQFIYTDDISQDTIADYCNKYYHPEILLLIVYIENVSKFELELINSLIQEINIEHGDNIRCVSNALFADFLGLNSKKRSDLFKIFDFSKNFNSNKIIYHHTEELRKILKQKKLYLFS